MATSNPAHPVAGSPAAHRGIRLAPVWAALLWSAAVLAGCSAGSVPESSARATQGAFDRGLAAFEQQSWDAAEQELTAALDGAGLQPDLYERALLLRARARMQSGRLDDASLDLTLLAQGAADMDQVWAARGELALKQGDKLAATEAYREAQKLNRQITLPTELK